MGCESADGLIRFSLERLMQKTLQKTSALVYTTATAASPPMAATKAAANAASTAT